LLATTNVNVPAGFGVRNTAAWQNILDHKRTSRSVKIIAKSIAHACSLAASSQMATKREATHCLVKLAYACALLLPLLLAEAVRTGGLQKLKLVAAAGERCLALAQCSHKLAAKLFSTRVLRTDFELG
jgi:hypothetical protein